MSKRKLAVFGNYNVGNFGDELILESIRQRLTNYEILATGYEIEMFPSGIRSISSALINPPRFFKNLKKIKSANFAIIGGGGLFTDENSYKAVWIWFCQAFFLHKLNIRFAHAFQSFSEPKSIFGRLLLKHSLNYAEFIAVRDSASELVVKEFTKKEVLKSGDVVVGLQITEIKPFPIKKYIVLSLRKLKTDYFSNIVPILKDLIADGYTICAVNMGNEPVSDIEFMRYELSKHEISEGVIFIQPKNTNELLSIYEHSESVIGLRLHSIILASIFNKPFVAISYESKVTNFCNDINAEMNLLQVRNLSAAALKSTFKNATEVNPEYALKETKEKIEQTFLKLITHLQS